MYLYDEVDSIDFLDQALNFFLLALVNYLYWSTPVLMFCVTVAGGFKHHHAIIHKMPSTIFLQVTT
jgi:hypothetical protein